MAAVSATPRGRPSGRIDPIAAAWGGLVGGVGLMAGGPRDLAARLAIVAAAFLLAGFLAGVRSIARRVVHAAYAWAVAQGLYLVFVALATVGSALGGPDPPDALPGTGEEWLLVTAASLVCAVLGGALANSWLRPAGQGKRYS
jgi:hypothetical protein